VPGRSSAGASKAAFLVALAVLAAAAALPAAGGSWSESHKPRPLCFGKRATIVGTQRSEDILGTEWNDVIVGLGGSDAILALGGSDRVCGGPGNDDIETDGHYLSRPSPNDRADGGPGRDTCRGAERAVRCEETRPDIFRDGDLGAGAYVVETFRPRVGFVVGSGWSVPFTPLPTQILLGHASGSVRFDSIRSSQGVAPTIGRFAGIPGVDAGAPVPATIGNAVGQRIEFTVTSRDFVVVPGLTERYEVERGDLVRAYALSVRGATVSIFVEAPAGTFAAFETVVDSLLASVRWG
jgi:hypothetical protein